MVLWQYGTPDAMEDIVATDRAGRMVIPKAIRKAAGIDERAKLLVAVTEEGRIVLQKLDGDTVAARLEKELADRDVDAIARKVREEVRARIRKQYPNLPA